MRIKFEVFVDVNPQDVDGKSIQPSGRDIQIVKNKTTSIVLGSRRDDLTDMMNTIIMMTYPRIEGCHRVDTGGVKMHVEVSE